MNGAPLDAQRDQGMIDQAAVSAVRRAMSSGFWQTFDNPPDAARDCTVGSHAGNRPAHEARERCHA